MLWRAANWKEQIIDGRCSNGRRYSILVHPVVAGAFQNGGRKKNLSAISCDHCLRKFAGQMIRMRRFPSVHFWASHQARLDRLPEADFVGKDCPLGKRRFESEERRLDLMRIEIHLRVKQGAPRASRNRRLNAGAGAHARRAWHDNP